MTTTKPRIKAWLRVGTTEYSGTRVSPDLPARIENLGLQILRRRGFLTSVSGEYVVDVVIAPLESGGYVSNLVVLKGEEEVTDSRVRSKCDFCLEDELLTQIKGVLEASADAIEGDAAPKEVESAPVPPPVGPIVITPPPVTRPPVVVDTGAETAPQRGLGRPGRVGVAALIVGAAALGSGVALLVRGERTGADYKAPGFALAGVGGVALLTGIGLLVVDREGARRHAVAPSASQTGAGLVWVGRF